MKNIFENIDLSQESINEKVWKNLGDDELDVFTKQIFQYYRNNGFPYHTTDDVRRKKNIEQLLKYDHYKLIENDDIIKQTMHGLGFAWSFFPHAYEVPCGNKRTPMDVFSSDELFLSCIRKRLKIGTYISDSGIRKMLSIFSNTQVVSNFRPTAAAAIYDKYAPENGVVWDMSGGWGGRLLGALKSHVGTYIATEPSTDTYEGLENMVDYIYEKCSQNTRFVIENCGSEDFLPDKETIDLCFTSPPYFDLEKYSDEPTQSYIKYPEYNLWLNGFLSKTFDNCHYSLKKGGYMIINIADKKNSRISLEKDTVKTAIKLGFKYVDTIRLALSNPNMKNRTSAFKYEPVIVFIKK